MKKLLSMGLLTVCALAVAEQQAQAWVNSKFSIGLNWQTQAANNNFLWGVFKNGQVPGPEAFGVPGHGSGNFGPGGGYMPPAAQQMFPYYGSAPAQYNPTAPVGYPQGIPPAFQQGAPNLPSNAAAHAPGNAYQPVTYQHRSTYPAYYPYASQYSYQAPYYWYQSR